MALGGLTATATGQVVPDSARADSLPPEVDLTAKFLEVSELARQTVPVMLRLEPAAPQPTYSRMIFTRDSIEWNGAGSLGDLLAQVPGAYVWRAGGLMQPEMVSYRGRGATSVEYILDGQPLIALGPDSVGVDPAQFVLGMLDRVEIERWPDVLRVHLFTRDHDRLAPASRLAIGTGDQSVARYQGTFEKRWKSGLGLGLGGDFLNFPTGSFQAGDRLQTQFWGQLNYVPTARIGVQYQVFGTSIDRDPIRAAVGDTLSKSLDGSRLDQQVRFFWRKQGDGQGLRTDILLGQSKWSGSGVDQSTVNYGVAVSQRSPRAFWRARLGGSSRWTPVEVRGEAGWAPTQGLSASAEGVFQRHEGNRTSAWLGLRGGLGLPLGMVATASGRFGRQVVAPAVTADTAQDIASLDLTLGLQRDAFALSGGVLRRDVRAVPSGGGLAQALGRHRVGVGYREIAAGPVVDGGGLVQQRHRHAARRTAGEPRLGAGGVSLEVPPQISQYGIRSQVPDHHGGMGLRHLGCGFCGSSRVSPARQFPGWLSPARNRPVPRLLRAPQPHGHQE